jgi:peptide/nickel transport system permease protein
MIKEAWQAKRAFRVALVYLILLGVLILVLPFLPLPFNPNELDLEQVSRRPFDWSSYHPEQSFHWFGTDALGRDVLSNMLYGARTAFVISLPAMLLTTMLGILLGAAAGLYGDEKAAISRGRLLMLLISLAIFSYYGLYMPLQLVRLKFEFSALIHSFLLALVVPAVLLSVGAALLRRWSYFRKLIALPLDQLVLRLIEVLTSIPKLILLLVLAAFAPPSLLLLVLLLIFTYWTGTARLARAETMRIKEMLYFEAAISMGVPHFRLIYRHVLPNLLAPVMVSFVFGLASLMMLESTLSFLNIGVTSDLVSWGRTIAGIRSNTSAWWLVAFPGAFLSLTMLALQTCSYYLLKVSQEKQ